jgi:uncharacterized protein YndB with AHSA1/START domain
MGLESLEVSTWLPVAPDALYRAWLDSKAHAAFTGAEAKVQPRVGGNFYAWDGYIVGTTLELQPGARIVQAWSTSEFPEDHEPSRLEVLLAPDAGGTRITIKHSDIPEGQADAYEQGWEEHYFVPMRRHFVEAAPKQAKAVKKPAAKAKKATVKAKPKRPAAKTVKAAPRKKTPAKKAKAAPKKKSAAKRNAR